MSLQISSSGSPGSLGEKFEELSHMLKDLAPIMLKSSGRCHFITLNSGDFAKNTGRLKKDSVKRIIGHLDRLRLTSSPQEILVSYEPTSGNVSISTPKRRLKKRRR